MESKRKIDCILREFPSMSAHFAHTLDDMADKYLKINYVELTDESGVLEADKLSLVKASKATVILYNDIVYKLSKIEGNAYKYVATIEGEDKKAQFDQINVDIVTGLYVHEPLFNEIPDAPSDGDIYGRKDNTWVKLSDNAVEYSFISGALNKEELSMADLDSFDKYSTPIKDRIERKYKLKETSYIWFCSLNKKIDYIAHAGGLEIDYTKDPQILEASYQGDKKIWYCYRTTYPLVPDTWNLIIKFTKEGE